MIKLLCDHCKTDLTYSRGGYDHCLRLSDRKFGPDSCAVADYYMEPLLDDEKIFCGFACLKKWLEEK